MYVGPKTVEFYLLLDGDPTRELDFLRVARYIGFNLQVRKVTVDLGPGWRMETDTMYVPPRQLRPLPRTADTLAVVEAELGA